MKSFAIQEPNHRESIYRERFAQELGSVLCHELRAEKFGSHGQEKYLVLLEHAASI